MNRADTLADNEPAVISTQGLSKTYNGVPILKALTLKVPRHTICGFLGPNGSGKTTAIKILLGLVRPTGGHGTIFGRDIVQDSLAIRRSIGYLPQEPRFYDSLTARETLRFVAHFFYTGPQHALEERIAHVLDLVGLTQKADRPIRGFSGGEKQRLGIAQAQINAPDLLILDEPAAALDPLGRRDVLEVMQRLRQRTTIFYSTHLLEDVQRVSDMVAILKQGELILQAPLHALLTGQSLTYEIVLRGTTPAISQHLAQQPWVSSLQVLRESDQVVWRVTVNDQNAAEAALLPLLTTQGTVQILSFGLKQQTLEDIFVSLMEEHPHVS